MPHVPSQRGLWQSWSRADAAKAWKGLIECCIVVVAGWRLPSLPDHAPFTAMMSGSVTQHVHI